ncbi:hypothetical protein ACH4L7_33395 [Streptomyces anulatus]
MTYDARSRLLTDDASTYSYTARSTLASVSASTGGTRTVAFDAFDAFERNIANGSTSYAYASLDRTNISGTTSFTYGGGCNQLFSEGRRRFTRGMTDAPDGSRCRDSCPPNSVKATVTLPGHVPTDRSADPLPGVAGLPPDTKVTTTN